MFIEKQDDVRGGSLGLYFDEQRAKDLMIKYVQNGDEGDRIERMSSFTADRCF